MFFAPATVALKAPAAWAGTAEVAQTIPSAAVAATRFRILFLLSIVLLLSI
jgi:ABC-type uncharacterized transport system permease subunit